MAGIDAQTVLLLHCDGSDGSTLFSDSSQYLHAMSRSGVKVDTDQSKFGGASALFQGTVGQWITTPDSADWFFAAGDFTIDFWIRFNSVSADQVLIGQWDVAAGNGGWYLLYQANGNLQFTYRDSSNNVWYATRGLGGGAVVGQWYHFAVVRSGTAIKLFVNGTQIGGDYTVGTASLYNSPNALTIGSFTTTGNSPTNGWIDEIRISKGVARWTAGFTPPDAPYSAGGGTYTDAPSGGVVLGGSGVISGGVSSGGGVDDNCVLMLFGDGADGSTVFTDSSQSHHAMSAAGGAQVVTATSVFGGSSLFFDALGSYITSPNSADWEFGSGDFTLDFWVRFTSIGANRGLLTHANSVLGWYLEWQTQGRLSFTYTDTGGTPHAVNNTWTPSLNTWYHVAFVRSGSVFKAFINGVQIGGDAPASDIRTSTDPFAVGAEATNGFRPHAGFLDEVRISKGIARWTSNFTPPFAPYPVVGGTYTDTPSGGIALGGTSLSTQSGSLTKTGGVVLGGSCASTRAIASTPTGGIVLGGPALVGPVKLTVRLLSGGVEVASWQHQLVGNQARVSWTQFQLPSLGVPVIRVTMGKAKLLLKAKPVATIFEYTVVYDRATLLLRAKPFRAVEPDHIQPQKPKLWLKGKPFTLLMSQQLTVGKPKLILRGKPIARAGAAGLVPSPPHSLTLVPLACQDKGVLTPTAPKSTLLVPTARRSV